MPPSGHRRMTASKSWRSYAAGSEVDHFAKFCKEHLVQSEGRWEGKPLVLEPWQRRMMGEALAFDSDGWPVWRSVVIVCPRKNGKTAMLSAVALYRLLTSAGRPEILLAAPSDKVAGRLFDAAARFVRRSEELSGLLRVRDHAGEIVREDGMGIMYRLSSDPARLYGFNPTDVIVDELAQWATPNLRRAYAALTSGGGARSAPTAYTITTAGAASQRHDSILGRLLDAALDAEDIDREPGLTVGRLHEARTLVYEYAAPTNDPFDVKAMKLANPASWITESFLRRQAEDPELTDAQVLQLHGDVWAASETTWVAPDAWAMRANLKGRSTRGNDSCLPSTAATDVTRQPSSRSRWTASSHRLRFGSDRIAPHPTGRCPAPRSTMRLPTRWSASMSPSSRSALPAGPRRSTVGGSCTATSSSSFRRTSAGGWLLPVIASSPACSREA
jgi:phage terminase large subunit-like protein